MYNLSDDPWEQVDLAPDPAHARALADLSSLLWRHLEQTKDPILRGAITAPHHRQAVQALQKAAGG
jgi:arylsulfatase A-like enzyme